MGRAVDPRLTLRLSPAEHARLDAAALALGVETGGLAKAAALAGLEAAVVAVRSGGLRLRGRSGGGRSTAAAVPVPVPVPVRVERVLEPGELRAAAFRRALERRS